MEFEKHHKYIVDLYRQNRSLGDILKEENEKHYLKESEYDVLYESGYYNLDEETQEFLCNIFEEDSKIEEEFLKLLGENNGEMTPTVLKLIQLRKDAAKPRRSSDEIEAEKQQNNELFRQKKANAEERYALRMDRLRGQFHHQQRQAGGGVPDEGQNTKSTFRSRGFGQP